MKKLFHLLFNYNKDMRELEAQLAESKRQEKRIEAAYALYRDVYQNYGPEYAARMVHPDIIIEDKRSITLINYLDI